MSEKWLENIKRNDAATLTEKFFPGRIFGEKTEQVAELCRIAEKISFSDNDMIQKFVTSYFGDDTFVLNDETIATDGRRIIGKKYISDGHSKNGTCNQCREYAGRVFKWPEEKETMPVVPRHPNCKCNYENVYEKSSIIISSLSPEKIIMPRMTPKQWDKQSKIEKLNWCNLFKTKFSEYISMYSVKYNVPKSLLTLIIANELIDWQNVDGTVLDGIRGGGVGYAQIAVDTLLYWT